MNHGCCEGWGLTSQKAFQGAVAPQAAGPVFHGAVGTAYVPPEGTVTRLQDVWNAIVEQDSSRMLTMEPMETGSRSGMLGAPAHGIVAKAMPLRRRSNAHRAGYSSVLGE